MLKFRIIKLLCISLTLVACAHTTKQELEEDVVSGLSQSLPELNKQWQVDSVVTPSEVPWIHSFNDPVLETLVNEALENNRQLMLVEASLTRARALTQKAGASLTPAVAIGAAMNNQQYVDSTEPDYSSVELGLNIHWEVDLWGRIRAGVNGVVSNAFAVEQDLKFAQYSISAATIKAYLAAVETEIQKKIAKENISILEKARQTADVLFENGMAHPMDVALAKSDLARAREFLTEIELLQREALRALEILVGRYPAGDIKIKENLPDVPAVVPAGVPADLLTRRPDIVAASHRVAAAYYSTQEAKLAKLPNISLSNTIGASSDSLSSILDINHVAWQLGFNLLAPLIDGGRREADINLASGGQKEALANYAQIVLQALTEVESSLDQGASLASSEKYLFHAVEHAEKAVNIAKLNYENGELDLLDMLTIQQRLIAVKSQYAAIRRKVIEQRVDLSLVLGGSWLLSDSSMYLM